MLVYHADWSSGAGKRWAVRAILEGDEYVAEPPERVGACEGLLEGLRAAGRPVLAGFDFPLGVPRAWAAAAGVATFPALLLELGRGEWSELFDVASEPREIGVRRPFYPRRSTGVRRGDLTGALGLSWDDLYRRCERSDGRRACPLFWTLGGNQVGRAALAGWRELIVPAVEHGRAGLWPFDGGLEVLLADSDVVVVESYPAAYYGWLGLRGAKTRPLDRRANAPPLLRAAERLGVRPRPALRNEIEAGFADDDCYDAFVGLLGMVGVLRGELGEGLPEDDDAVVAVEGWILGRSAAA